MSRARERAVAAAKSLPDSSLPRLRQAARKLWAAKHEVAYLEERLKDAKKEVERLSTSEVLEVFDALNCDTLGVQPEGNQPGFDVEVKPYYEGGISAEWPEEQREKAFALLEEYGHGGLIKSLVTIQVPRGPKAADTLKKLQAAVDKLKLPAETKKGVHASTFKSWLKTEMQSGRPMPPLADIGAYVGRRVTIKERKPEKE